jgi:hypothetical protein
MPLFSLTVILPLQYLPQSVRLSLQSFVEPRHHHAKAVSVDCRDLLSFNPKALLNLLLDRALLIAAPHSRGEGIAKPSQMDRRLPVNIARSLRLSPAASLETRN